ncbi:hypothetical protein PVAG01_02606 [Phlyctema vagabunda]|uniref:Uncharacterized protein n=1 Tax=Phlyctema vagabunda TaxID=108571 RepID=A0ABR4PR23_9HELO
MSDALSHVPSSHAATTAIKSPAPLCVAVTNPIFAHFGMLAQAIALEMDHINALCPACQPSFNHYVAIVTPLVINIVNLCMEYYNTIAVNADYDTTVYRDHFSRSLYYAKAMVRRLKASQAARALWDAFKECAVLREELGSSAGEAAWSYHEGAKKKRRRKRKEISEEKRDCTAAPSSG